MPTTNSGETLTEQGRIDLARRAWHVLPPGLRRPLARQLRPVLGKVGPRLPHRPPPLLSVIVPVYNVEAFLNPCLATLRRQAYRTIEIIVVDDGSTDDSSRVYLAHAAADPRVRILRQTNAGLGAARNAGIAIARGKYLTFLDSDDTLPRHGYAQMVASLQSSGSDFVTGAVRRTSHGKFTAPWWITLVHEHDRIGITLDDFPNAVKDVIACNRMFRRSFWDEQALRFPEGVAYEDHLPMMTAYVTARKFDILKAVTYYWRIREDQSSIGQQKRELSNLQDRLGAKAAAWEMLARLGSTQARRAWLVRVLDLDLPLFIELAPYADQAYRDALRDGVRPYVEAADEQVWAGVRTERRVKSWLVANDRFDALREYDRLRMFEAAQMRTTVAEGRMYAQLPFYDDPAVGVRRELYEVGVDQAALITSLRGVRWTEQGQLEVTVWAYVRYLDLTDSWPQVSVDLVEVGTGRRQHLPTESFEDQLLTAWGRMKYQNYDRGAFRFTVDPAELASAAELDEPQAAAGKVGIISRWYVEVSWADRGISRTAKLGHRDLRSSPAVLHGRELERANGGPRLIALTHWSAMYGLSVELQRPPVILTSLQIEGRRVHGTLTCHHDLAYTTFRMSAAKIAAAVPLHPVGGQEFSFDLELPELNWHTRPLDARIWTVEATGPGRRTPQRLKWPAQTPGGWIGDGPHAQVAALRTPRQATEVRDVSCFPVISAVDLGEDAIVLTGRWVGPMPVGEWAPQLGNQRVQLQPSAVQVRERDFTITFPTVLDEWGFGPKPLPSGTYALQINLTDDAPAAPTDTSNRPAEDLAEDDADPAEDKPTTTFLPFVEPRMDPELIASLSTQLRGERLHLQLTRGDASRVRLVVGPPVPAADLSNWGQQQLQDWYHQAPITPDPDAVLFQCYRGETATDSQLAIHQELRRRNAPLRLYWGVSDLSVPLPEGAIPLLMRSREWYEQLAGAGYLCNNIDFDRWFTKRDHQLFLQTFHGYPFKSMGRSFWSMKDFSEDRMAHEIERRRAAWDVILTPTEEMNQLYRDSYGYTGPILDQGYPRDDALLDSQADQVRKRTREALGIHPDQSVLIYAPTWRDALATGAWSAALTNYLDLTLAAEELGESYVLLMRGHNYNARTGRRSRRTARLLDVTDYPDINDLILAADIAVLDYSSMRFDVALTGKPMVFLVPDLEEYTGPGRGVLFDYTDTAPGPLLSTTPEVIDAVRDIDAVHAQYAEQYAAFNARFNRHQDGSATARVVDAIFGDRLGPSPHPQDASPA